MIKWASPMFYDEIMKKKKRLLRKSMRADTKSNNVYCVTLSANPNDLFDIINMNEFHLQVYKNADYYALGLAYGYDSAIELVVQMVNEVYQNTGDVRIREYYQDRWSV